MFHLEAIQEILKRYWGYDTFRPLQEDIITSVLSGKDTLALLPTGGGKSVCYQVPALAQEGICLVISPLIALMKDQVENLNKRGILAAAIYSGMSRRMVVQTLKNVAFGPYKLLYVSPERLETSLFKEYMPALGINLIAVDEAHCISQWGYDFRPSYLRIAALRKELPNVPILALTASATKAVQQDICEKLDMQSTQLFRQSYTRANLSYSVFKPDSKLSKLVDILSKVKGSAIVYCKSRRRTIEIAELLTMHRLSAQHYHAGLPGEQRSQRQQDWIDGKTAIIVCTNAFGMGIDKPDVRLVVHVDLPDCLESYYQEAGRAGRDGKKSYSVLLYNEEDITELSGAHLKRFPDLDAIRNVYSALVNHLQIPSYTGDETSFTFHFEPFVRNFGLNSTTALYALKAIEQDGWLNFNEKSFTPSTVVFTGNKAGLENFQSSYPQHEPLLTTLLRTYSGIFDLPVTISEKVLAGLLRKSETDIKQSLQEIHAFGQIRYAPTNDAPQIIFQKHRVPVNEFSISMAPFIERKKAFVERVEKMIAYAKSEDCRSLFINQYFGDADTKPCGICDNCLRAKGAELTREEADALFISIQELLSRNAYTAPDLLLQLKGFKKEKAWKAIEFLQAENKIRVDSKGLLQLN
ncbi:MAG: ATP-dependent helicase RecQ [Flaviaesturariibacter sp.]|nr:ATP-dependent helicase RecQ [Flaviaesturariibacter sp.]